MTSNGSAVPMTKSIPFLDLRIDSEPLRTELLEAVQDVFRHGRFILGPEVQQLEEELGRYCGRAFAVSVNSGTDALYLALKSLDIGPGDEVVTTALSWIATANAIALTGATPVFADIRPDLNIDPDSVRQLISSNTKAILPVHYTGKICEMDEILEIATSHQLHVIEDASQAFGASLDNRRAGSFGTVSCLSMNPMKVLAACGEAGMVFTDRAEIDARLRSLRYNGMVDREVCTEPSLNGRMDTLQAAILLRRLKYVGPVIDARRRIAAQYSEHIARFVDVPSERPNQRDVYYTYTIQTDRRDELQTHLETAGIEVKVRDPILMPDQPAYRDGVRGSFPTAGRLIDRLLCLPASERMTPDDVDYVIQHIQSFFR